MLTSVYWLHMIWKWILLGTSAIVVVELCIKLKPEWESYQAVIAFIWILLSVVILHVGEEFQMSQRERRDSINDRHK